MIPKIVIKKRHYKIELLPEKKECQHKLLGNSQHYYPDSNTTHTQLMYENELHVHRDDEIRFQLN